MEQIYRFPAAGRGLSRREKNDEGQEKDLYRPLSRSQRAAIPLVGTKDHYPLEEAEKKN